MREKKVKQTKHGLRIEKNFSVIKNAGFRASRKHDGSVNRRAGLHDKKKNLVGERRVYKCKPLGLVRIRRIKQIAATAAAGLVAVVAYFGMGFLFKPDFIYVEELGNSTVCAAGGIENGDAARTVTGVKSGKAATAAEITAPVSATGAEYYLPTDGSLPTDHTLIENVAYMNYVLRNQTSWSSYMQSTVNTVMKQHVYTHKKFYDGILISADMPQGASNIARQFCVDSEDVTWREKSDNYIYDSMDSIAWPANTPFGLTTGKFRIYRGLPANEFSVYILNELTVKNFDEKTVEEKGVDPDTGKKLYTMKLDLRVHQEGLDSAVHYYKQQMYVTGGLYDWPTFDYTYVTYTFTEDWVVKEFTINDSYAAKMGSVSAPCTSESTTVFDYDEVKAENTFYGDYFNQAYNEWDPTSSTGTPTAASCLASAFGDVLTKGATLKLELNVDEKPVNGAVYLGLDGGNFNDLRVMLNGAGVGEIKVYMVDESGKKTLYIAVGTNKYKICLDTFASADNGGEGSGIAAQAEENASDASDASVSGGFAFDLNSLIDQLFGGNFELGKKGKTATLESELELFGLKVPIKFSFNIKKGVASLNDVTAKFKLGKNDVAARLTFGTEADIPAKLSAAEQNVYTDVADGITLGVNLGLGDIKLNGNVFVGFAEGGLGEVRAKFGELAVYYAADENTLYFAHGKNVKYKLNLSTVASDGNTGDSGSSDGLSGILGGLDINSIISDVISNFYIGGGKISTGMTVDLQQQLQQILSLAVAVDFNNGIAVDLNGEISGKQLSLNVKLASDGVPELTDKAEYVDILNGGISADIALTVDGIQLGGVLYLELTDGEVNAVRVALNNSAIKVYYEKELNAEGTGKDDVIYIDLGASKIKLPVSALTGGEAQQSGLDIGALFKDVNVKEIIGQVLGNLGGGENKLNSSLTLTVNGENVPVSFDIDLGKQIAVNLQTELFKKTVTAKVELKGSPAPQITDKAEYVDILNGGISADIALTVDGIQLGGVLYLELADGEVNAVRVALNNSAVKVYYEKELNAEGTGKDDVIYIDLGSSKIKLPLSALTGGESGGKAKQGGLDIGALFKDINVKEIIGQVLGNLGGGENKFNSSLTLTVGGENVPVSFDIDLGRQIAVNLQTELFKKTVTAKVSLGGSAAPEPADKANYIDVVNDGFALSGNILLNANGKTAVLKVNGLSLKLNGGFEFALDARVIFDGKYFDLYASYIGGTITVVYGSDEGTEGDKGNYAGVRVNTDGDLELLKDALTDAYNRLCIAIGEISPAAADAVSKENLEKLISGIGAGSASTDVLAEIFKLLGVEVGEGETLDAAYVLERLGIPVGQNGAIDIKGLIEAVEIKPSGNGFALNLGNNISINLGLADGAVDGGVSVEIGNASATVAITGFKLGAFAPECPISADELVSAQDLADALDYAVAALELAAEKEFAIDADVIISENGETAMEIGALVEYNQGENGFPVHIDGGKANAETGLRENVNFWIDSTAYLHLNLEILNNKEGKDDLFVDAYVLDANPANSDFKTGGAYTTDGKLDMYVSVSNGGGNPMALYLPMEDILTVVAMGGAMLNLAEVRVDREGMEDLNKAIRQVANVLDELLVQNYVGGLTSQFQSIGDSIVEQILRGQKINASNLSELLELAIDFVFGKAETPDNGEANGAEGGEIDGESVEGGAANYALTGDGEIAESVPVTPIVPLFTCGNYVKRIEFTRGEVQRELSVILNSKAIYGGGFNDIEFNITKDFYTYEVMPTDGAEIEEEASAVQTVNKSYITGISLRNVYYGENNANRLDIAASIGHEAAKPASLANYHNFSDISTLIAAFVNSATHEIEEENVETDGSATEGENGTITATDIAKKYGLNSNYYISGNVKLSVLLYNPEINIDYFYVTINGDNTVEFNVRLSYEKFSAIFGLVKVLTDTATVDLTIKDDMAYMRKAVEGGATTTRVMTLSAFGGDIMNQLAYMLSFSDMIKDAMNGDGDSGNGGGLKFNDFGDYLDLFLANYSFTDGANGGTGNVSWNLDINKKGINSLVGMGLMSENIGVGFNATRNADETFSLKSLTIGGKLFGLISLNATLNYKNPQNIWDGGVDLSGNIIKLDSAASCGVEGQSWTNILGGTKFADIQKKVNWNKLCRETSGSTYVEYTGSNLYYGTLKFTYATDTNNAEFKEFGTRQQVLYGATGIYTLYDIPDVNEVMPAVPVDDDKLVGAWKLKYNVADETDVYGEVIEMRAEYANVFVSIISSQEVADGINGFKDCEFNDDFGYIYKKQFKYDETTVNALEAHGNLNAYIFNGYYDYYTGEKAESFVADRTVTLYADWVGKKINITYVSDIAVNGGEESAGVYTTTGSVQFGTNDRLKTPTTEVQNVTFLGWFMEVGESYVYIADAQALKDYLNANVKIDGDSIDVKLWSVWVDRLEVTVTSASYSLFNLRVKGNYNGGGGYASAKSNEIAAAMGMTHSAGVELCSSATGMTVGEAWSKSFKNDGVSFDFKNTCMLNTDYGGARITVTYSVNGTAVTSISEVAFKATK